MHWKPFLILQIAAFFLNLLSNAYADEKWTIKKFKGVSYAIVSGEVQSEDKLGFFISIEDNCKKVWQTFSFLTFEQPGDIKQLLHKHLPIKLNGNELTAKVEEILPHSRGYKIIFSLGEFPIGVYVQYLYDFYGVEKKFEIEIIDGIDFKVKKYHIFKFHSKIVIFKSTPDQPDPNSDSAAPSRNCIFSFSSHLDFRALTFAILAEANGPPGAGLPDARAAARIIKSDILE